MRVIFMGSPDFAVPTLDAVAAAGHEVLAAYTQPPRPAGRGKAMQPTAVERRAREMGIEVRSPKSLKNAEEQAALAALGAEVAVVAAYGLILPQPILDTPRLGCVNVHGSLLPRWRGAAPVERALMAGDAETGVTIHRTVKELDAGPIAAQRAFLVTPEDDAGTVYARVAELAVELLDEVLPEPTFRPQEGEPSYAAKIEPDDRVLDLSRPVESLNRIRALSPHIGARAELHGRPVTIWRARLEDGELLPLEVQPEGGRRMDYDSFLRGLR